MKILGWIWKFFYGLANDLIPQFHKFQVNEKRCLSLGTDSRSLENIFGHIWGSDGDYHIQKTVENCPGINVWNAD